MWLRLVYIRMELKRAFQRLPQMVAGAIVLLFLAGTIALFSSRALYGEQAAGRILVGVVAPEGDVVVKKAFSMLESLDSVKSLCDFRYLGREEGYRRLESGELYALMEAPKNLVQGIMDGTNPPVRVLLPKDAGLESRIFQELTDAAAVILGCAQAGIYAGDQMLSTYGHNDQIPLLERELNKIFLSYSLPREDYFRHVKVSATGDLDPAGFYGISAYVLILLLCAIPVSGYLLPWRPVMRQKLSMAGVGAATRAMARVLGLGLLFLAVSVPIVAAAAFAGYFPMDGRLLWKPGDWFLAAGTLAAVCLAAASVVALLYRIAGSLLGGIMLLFLTVTAQHFLAGGFLPLVFLPESLRNLASVLPSYLLMKGAAMGATASWEPVVFGELAVLAAAAVGLAAALEVWER